MPLVEYNAWQLREQNKESWEDVGLVLPLNLPSVWRGLLLLGEPRTGGIPHRHSRPSSPAPPSTWHRDPGEGLRLAQRVHLDMPECLAHGALQVPTTQEDAGEPLRPLGG